MPEQRTAWGSGGSGPQGAGQSALSTTHPDYDRFIALWEQQRDTYDGERAVKWRGARYLAPTSGMRARGWPDRETEGWHQYEAYKMRAVFDGVHKRAVDHFVGVMHRKPPRIQLPDAMADLRDRATSDGESLEMLLRRINTEQLAVGRIGLFVDNPENTTTPEPYLATYDAELVINWDTGSAADEVGLNTLNLVVLNESREEREPSGFTWQQRDQYRVLQLGELETTEAAGGAAVYTQHLFRSEGSGTAGYDPNAMEAPTLNGQTTNRIPFVFINACDIATTPDKAPTEAVSNLDLTIYRGEADRRQALFMQGQDTLAIIGSTAETEEGTPVAVGAGEVLEIPIGGDAKYIGASSQGIPEMRQALEGDRDRAEMLTDALGNAQDASRASGEALSIRVSARTATLTQVAKTGAFGLQTALRILAEWLGANPDQVIVEPNLDFAAKAVEGRQLVDFMTARSMGMPLSLEQLHRWSAERGVTELTFEEELEQIAAEAEAAEALAGAESTNAEGPADDEDEAPPDDEDQAA